MNERESDRQYHHTPDQGETVSPDFDDPGDPHDEVNTPLDELPEQAPGQAPVIEGMGSRPPARGERVSNRKPPPDDE
ncbi:MAG: hypothetical protein ACJ738_12550 [Gaiellales bacterium]